MNTNTEIITGSGGSNPEPLRFIDKALFLWHWLRARRWRLIVILGAVLLIGLGVSIYILGHNQTPQTKTDKTASTSKNNQKPEAKTPTAQPSTKPVETATTQPPKVKKTPTSGSNTAPPSTSGWPGASNTGVPSGTVLGAYYGCNGGEAVITTANTVIDSKQVNCDLVIRATGIVIRKSLIKGIVNTDEDQPGSFTMTDSEVTGGLGTKNMTIGRSNIHGGIGPNVYCYTNCYIYDSWLHTPAFPVDNPEAHLGAFLANDNGPNGSTTNVNLVHNTIHCDTPPSPQDGGCSGDVNLFGDFGPITYVTIDNNWFGASTGISYCFYGGDSSTKPYPHADHVVVKNNLFQKGTTGKCGAYGAVTGFNLAGIGNVWSNNKWSDGVTVVAEN